MVEHSIRFIDLGNFEKLQNEGKIVDRVQIHQLVKARRGVSDSRGYLIQKIHPSWQDFRFASNPVVQGYDSFTYIGQARDPDQWHVHPSLDNLRGIPQCDRWSFNGKAIVAVADPETKLLNLFKMGFYWGENGGFMLYIPPYKYHGFLSAGGVIDDEGQEGVWISNFPDQPYNTEEPGLIEGRVPFAGSGVQFSDGRDFNWDDIKEVCRIPF